MVTKTSHNVLSSLYCSVYRSSGMLFCQSTVLIPNILHSFKLWYTSNIVQKSTISLFAAIANCTCFHMFSSFLYVEPSTSKSSNSSCINPLYAYNFKYGNVLALISKILLICPKVFLKILVFAVR